MNTMASTSRPRTRRRTDPPLVADPESIDVAPSNVAQRAYELFLARGGAHGNDVEDWLVAESELRRDRMPAGRRASSPRIVMDLRSLGPLFPPITCDDVSVFYWVVKVILGPFLALFPWLSA